MGRKEKDGACPASKWEFDICGGGGKRHLKFQKDLSNLCKEYNFLATLYSLPVVVGDVGKLFPPGAVDRVGEPGVVRIELGAVGQDLKNRHAI